MLYDVRNRQILHSIDGGEANSSAGDKPCPGNWKWAHFAPTSSFAFSGSLFHVSLARLAVLPARCIMTSRIDRYDSTHTKHRRNKVLLHYHSHSMIRTRIFSRSLSKADEGLEGHARGAQSEVGFGGDASRLLYPPKFDQKPDRIETA